MGINDGNKLLSVNNKKIIVDGVDEI